MNQLVKHDETDRGCICMIGTFMLIKNRWLNDRFHERLYTNTHVSDVCGRAYLACSKNRQMLISSLRTALFINLSLACFICGQRWVTDKIIWTIYLQYYVRSKLAWIFHRCVSLELRIEWIFFARRCRKPRDRCIRNLFKFQFASCRNLHVAGIPPRVISASF